MVNVDLMGYLYRVSNANYRRFLEATAAGEEAAGDYLGHDQGYILRVTDMTKEEAKELLASNKKQNRNKR